MRRKLYTFLILMSLLLVQMNPVIAQESPKSGDIIITEFMANPFIVSDTRGEWIELFNGSNKDLLMNGLILSDNGSNSHQIWSDVSIILKPGQYFLLARNDNPAENGGIQPDYIYSNFTLGNSEDEIILMTNEDSLIDYVHYNSEWDLAAGASFELDPASYNASENDNKENWHIAIDPYGAGDLGTPGATNSQSSGIYHEDIVRHFEAFPNPCQSEVMIRISANECLRSVQLINLLGQSINILSNPQVNSVSFNLDLSGFPDGIYWIEAIFDSTKKSMKLIKH